MTRIIWRTIREQLILPYLDVELKYYDLGSSRETRQRPDHDRRGQRHAKVRRSSEMRDHHPDEGRVKEFNLKQMWRSPNGTIRNISTARFSGTHHLQECARMWPTGIGRSHRASRIRRQYRATEVKFDGPVRSSSAFSRGRRHVIERECSRHRCRRHHGMFNLDESIKGFARACFNYALQRKYPSTSRARIRY